MNVDGVIAFQGGQFGGCFRGILGSHEFGDEVRQPTAVLDVAMKVESGLPPGAPLIPCVRRRVKGVDQHTIAVEQQRCH